MSNFSNGTVSDNLTSMHGTWHDVIELFDLDGTPLTEDVASGSPGASPFENLVYFDFDGIELRLTNVHIKGRPAAARTFVATLVDGVLVFDSLGPGAFENIGISGGPGVLTFNARTIDAASQVYQEPDFIYQPTRDTRVRHTILYRDAVAVRTLTAHGTRLSVGCEARHELDPRGSDGPVHEKPTQATIWSHLA